jgi:hypothetical protein
MLADLYTRADKSWTQVQAHRILQRPRRVSGAAVRQKVLLMHAIGVGLRSGEAPMPLSA